MKVQMGRRRAPAVLLWLTALLLASCATPMPPSGGPTDQTPPTIVETVPAADAVEVMPSSISLTFSEYVDPAAFARAFSINPAPDERPRFSWHGRRVEIRFAEPLRENTTYVLTLDNNLRDEHGVALTQPLTLAFSTGPTINRGRLEGLVIDPTAGTGLAGIDVLAYAAPDSAAPVALPERPAYRTQTDASGRFTFTYLNEQPYFVVALQDRNRNRRPDALEPFAVPPVPALYADTTAAEEVPRWIVTVLDSIPPEVQRVRARSDQRLALRFTEPVRLHTTATAPWTLRDSVAHRTAAVRAVYQLPGDPYQVYLLTEPLAQTPYLLTPGGVVDTSGLAVRPLPVRFTPEATADTLALRFQGFVPDTLGEAPVLLPPVPDGYRPAVRFNQPVDSTRLHTLVTVRDTTGQRRPFTAVTADGVTYALTLTPPLQPGEVVEVAVDGRALGADTLYTRRFMRRSQDALGELSGVVAAPDTSSTLVVELYPAAPADAALLRLAVADRTGRFIFRGLPEGTYRLRAYADRNDNRQWDGGRLTPYRDAEPLAWSAEELRVRARWETALSDTLRLPAR